MGLQSALPVGLCFTATNKEAKRQMSHPHRARADHPYVRVQPSCNANVWCSKNHEPKNWMVVKKKRIFGLAVTHHDTFHIFPMLKPKRFEWGIDGK